MMWVQPTDILSRRDHARRWGLLGRLWFQLLLIAIVSAAVYWPMLGNAGFGGTEGHRAIPAYHMLETGDWLVPHLFDRPYLRKPPGMPWAIAMASMALGQTEFAARAVSAIAATLSGVVALAFGRRWFGAAGGLFAGLAQVLMPVLWFPARTADIEALHNLGIQLAALSLVALIIERGHQLRAGWLMGLVLAAGISIAGLTKGPAGATTIASAILGPLLVTLRWRALTRPALLGGVAVGVGLVACVFWLIARRALHAGPEIVTQTVDDFLWQEGRTLHILLLAPTSLLMALPASLAMLYPWGPDARAEAAGPMSRLYPDAFSAARSLTIAVLVSLCMLSIAGVSNPRYTMPAQMLIAPIAGYVGLGLRGYFILKRPPIARAMMLGRPAVLMIVMVAAGITAIYLSEPRRERVSGRAAGEKLRSMIEPGATVWADYLIEARPDVLWYAAGSSGPQAMRILWRPLGTRLEVPRDPDTFLVLRDDPEAGEYHAYASAGLLTGFREVGAGSVYLYSFRVLHMGMEDDAPTGPRTGN